eukprot:3060765-Prorocentrum_lima.AAC.1
MHPHSNNTVATPPRQQHRGNTATPVSTPEQAHTRAAHARKHAGTVVVAVWASAVVRRHMAQSDVEPDFESAFDGTSGTVNVAAATRTTGDRGRSGLLASLRA